MSELKRKRVRVWTPEQRANKRILDSKRYFRVKAERPWEIVYHNILKRCNNDLGYAGVICFLTKEDVKFLWFRDQAYLLKRPSIDRKNNDKDYQLDNCEFIELRTRPSDEAKCEHEFTEPMEGYIQCRKCGEVKDDKTEEIEELAKELWSMFDENGETKWPTMNTQEKSRYLIRARALVNAGYRKGGSK